MPEEELNRDHLYISPIVSPPPLQLNVREDGDKAPPGLFFFFFFLDPLPTGLEGRFDAHLSR